MTTGKYENNLLSNDKIIKRALSPGAGATFDLTFFDNSKLINFDD